MNDPVLVKIEKSSYEEVIREATESQWDRDDTSQSHDVRYLAEVDKYEDLVFTPNKIQDEYFLVYATYSTGDSFGHDDGRFQEIAIYSELTPASKTKELLEEWTKKDKGFNTVIQLEDGAGGFKDFQFHVPWMGYFEHLENIEIKKLLLHRRVK